MNFRQKTYEPWHFRELAPNSDIKCPTCDQYYYNLVKIQEKTKQIKKEIESLQYENALHTRQTVLEGEFSSQKLILSNTKKDAQIDAKTDEINALQTQAIHMQARIAQSQKKLLELETEFRQQQAQRLVAANQVKQQEKLIEQLQIQLRSQLYQVQQSKEQATILRDSVEEMQRTYDSQVDQLRRSVNNYETSAAMRDFVASRMLGATVQPDEDEFEI